ncbi:MAG: hypothetical protein A2211_05080 [Rhodanobacter sp. RIFOXYA1_FULL_67_6]|nr:MAG: hypothetical protein A2211_05080 [Rhodanobacter sp. RIFOXYA1_FULL_67_6]
MIVTRMKSTPMSVFAASARTISATPKPAETMSAWSSPAVHVSAAPPYVAMPSVAGQAVAVCLSSPTSVPVES